MLTIINANLCGQNSVLSNSKQYVGNANRKPKVQGVAEKYLSFVQFFAKKWHEICLLCDKIWFCRENALPKEVSVVSYSFITNALCRKLLHFPKVFLQL